MSLFSYLQHLKIPGYFSAMLCIKAFGVLSSCKCVTVLRFLFVTRPKFLLKSVKITLYLSIKGAFQVSHAPLIIT